MDVEKTIQFLLEQQARFDARQAEYEARQTELVVRHAQFREAFEQGMIQINEVVLRLATAQERTNLIVTTLVERHVELEQNVNALVSAVEHHITNHK